MFLLDTIHLGRHTDKFLHLSFKNLYDKEKECRFFWHEGITATLPVIQQPPYVTFLEND
jgi:hypothetical protein